MRSFDVAIESPDADLIEFLEDQGANFDPGCGLSVLVEYEICPSDPPVGFNSTYVDEFHVTFTDDQKKKYDITEYCDQNDPELDPLQFEENLTAAGQEDWEDRCR